jgi:hypothetical protein
MGMYVYTMRKRTVKIELPTGEIVDANLMLCDFRANTRSVFKKPSVEDKRREDRLKKAEQIAAAPRSGYVVESYGVSKDKNGRIDYSEAKVYDNVTSGVWCDSHPFPGRLIGLLKKHKGRWQVVDESEFMDAQDLDQFGEIFLNQRMNKMQWTLYHVNIKTGETIQFSDKPLLPQKEAQQRALDLRVGIGRGARKSLWSVEARPHCDEHTA